MWPSPRWCLSWCAVGLGRVVGDVAVAALVSVLGGGGSSDVLVLVVMVVSGSRLCVGNDVVVIVIVFGSGGVAGESNVHDE